MKALISVYDKTGVIEAARRLHEAGVGLVSTGGTHKAISDAGVPVQQVSDFTGFPEILDGRVKTLHPHIHSGLLARRDMPEHMDELSRRDIALHRPVDWQPLPLQGGRKQAGRHPGRRFGEHRHRRTDDAPGGGKELPQRRSPGGPSGLRLGRRQIRRRRPEPRRQAQSRLQSLPPRLGL